MNEQMGASAPKEIAKIEKRRTINDAELLKKGADYEINEKGDKILNPTVEQKEEAGKEMEEHFESRASLEESAKIAEEKGDYGKAAVCYEKLVQEHGKDEFNEIAKKMYHNLAIQLEERGIYYHTQDTALLMQDSSKFSMIGAIEAYKKAGELNKAEELENKTKK